jgi:hypothetical protein
MSWKEPSERHNDALIEAIQHAAHLISTAITQGFKHMADREAQALADLQSAVTDLGAAIAIEITALQNAINAQGVNNSPAIETAVSNIRSLIGGLNASIASTTGTGTPAVPVITALNPTTGPTAGGTSVSVTGTGLTGATGVTVGGLAATGLIVASDTALSFTTPASVAGPAAVLVTGPGGVSAATTFTYADVITQAAAKPAV